MQVPVRGARSNFLYLVSGEGANKLARFIAAVFFARALTPAEFGDLNVAIAVSGILLVAVNFGLSDLGARDVAIEPERAASIAGRVVGFRMASLVVAGLPILAIMVLVWAHRPGLALLAYGMAAVMACSADWLARGLGVMSRVAIATGVGGIVVAGGAAALAVTGGTPTIAMGIFVLGELTTAILLWAFVSPMAKPKVRLVGARSLGRRALPVAVSSFVIYTYTANLDTIILAAARSSREAGLYSAAYRVTLALNAVGTLAAFALLPSMAREARAGIGATRAVRRIVVRAMVPLAILGIAAVAVTAAAGAHILRILFGSEFEVVAPTFVLLSIGFAWYITTYPAGYALLALGRNAAFMRGALAAGVTGLSLDLILIPPLGIIGAGIASACAFLLAAAVWTAELRLFWAEPASGYLPSLGAVALGSLLGLLVVVDDGTRLPAAVGLVALLAATSLFGTGNARRLWGGRLARGRGWLVSAAAPSRTPG
jgi:O-antigen/teichoic acid export membrane protein